MCISCLDTATTADRFTFLASQSAGYHWLTALCIDWSVHGLQIELQSKNGPAGNEHWSDILPCRVWYDDIQIASMLT